MEYGIIIIVGSEYTHCMAGNCRVVYTYKIMFYTGAH